MKFYKRFNIWALYIILAYTKPSPFHLLAAFLAKSNYISCGSYKCNDLDRALDCQKMLVLFEKAQAVHADILNDFAGFISLPQGPHGKGGSKWLWSFESPLVGLNSLALEIMDI
jgi:hypothetical protein